MKKLSATVSPEVLANLQGTRFLTSKPVRVFAIQVIVADDDADAAAAVTVLIPNGTTLEDGRARSIGHAAAAVTVLIPNGTTLEDGRSQHWTMPLLPSE